MDVVILRKVSFFAGLSDADLSALARLLTVREIKAGEQLLEEGTTVDALSIICDGVLHVRRLAQKREILLGRLGTGGFFGEINLFDPGVATASIYSMKAGKLAVVDYATLRAFMEANTDIGYKIVTGMMAEMARRLRQTSSRLVNSSYWTSSETGTP